MKKHGYPNMLNYVDDLIYIGLPHEINEAFQFLQCLLQDTGFANQSEQASSSYHSGGMPTNFDCFNSTYLDDKLAQIKNICSSWSSKTYCSKRDLQSLLGSLLYIAKCVKPAHYFFNCMLSLLRQNANRRKILFFGTTHIKNHIYTPRQCFKKSSIKGRPTEKYILCRSNNI